MSAVVEAGDAPPASLASRVRAGFGWSVLNNAATRITTFVSGLVLARLLSPQDFGVYAVALVVLNVLFSMNELGVSLAVVRWEGDVRRFAPTVMTLAVASSTVFYAVCWAVAPAIAGAMDSPESTAVIRLLGATIVIDAFACVPAGLLTREFAQARRLVVDLSSALVGMSLTISLAVQGVGPASLAWGRLAGSLLALTLLTALAPLRVRPGWDPVEARRLLRFGTPLAAASLLVLAVANVDLVVVGHVLGTAALGFYLLAFNLASWPVNFLSEAARRVSFAGFSRAATDAAMLARAYPRAVQALVGIGMPVCTGLAVYAEPVVRFLYGARWEPAADALRLLAAVGLLRMVFHLSYDLLVAAGRSRRVIALQACWLVALVPALLTGATAGGLGGAATAHLVVGLGLVLPAYLVTMARLGIPARAVLGRWVRPLAGAGVVAVAGIGVQRLFTDDFTVLVVGVVVTLVLYVPWVAGLRHEAAGAPAAPVPAAPMSGGGRPDLVVTS